MKRSKFSLSNYKLASMDMGKLVPLGLMEVLPGDTVQHATSALIRCSPMLAPVMHPVHARIHHWFVPHRLVWEDWEDFITGGPDGMDASVFPTITFATGQPAQGSLADYLGVPPGVTGNKAVSALPFRGYALIWNEWYRDQDLETALVISEASGADTTTSTVMQNVAWEKDYFTSARPWEQKGPSVSIPIAGNAPLIGLGIQTGSAAGIDAGTNVEETVGDRAYPFSVPMTAASSGRMEVTSAADHRPKFYADLSAVTGITVNALREALALQRFEEARARYGSRYVEYLRYLGVRSSDARLQRPEYLGGGKQTIQFSEVLQTGVTTSGSAAGVGNLRGHGIGAMRSNRYRRFFEEHGYVFSFISVKPRTMYVQGLARTWNRRTKEDFFQRELQHIGQQEILNKEVYLAAASPDGTFGFQDRYDEYRRTESTIAGEFRATTLDFWHMARIFASEPALNATFVSSVPTERIFASAATDVLYVMGMHSVQARRLLTQRGSSFTF